MSKKKYIFITAVVLILALVIVPISQIHAGVGARPEYSSSSDEYLGKATHFHMFANVFYGSVHTHGNVACNVFSTQSDGGTRYQYYPDADYSEITYIEKEVVTWNNQWLAGTLVLGNGFKILSDKDASQTRISKQESLCLTRSNTIILLLKQKDIR